MYLFCLDEVFNKSRKLGAKSIISQKNKFYIVKINLEVHTFFKMQTINV